MRKTRIAGKSDHKGATTPTAINVVRHYRPHARLRCHNRAGRQSLVVGSTIDGKPKQGEGGICSGSSKRSSSPWTNIRHSPINFRHTQHDFRHRRRPVRLLANKKERKRYLHGPVVSVANEFVLTVSVKPRCLMKQGRCITPCFAGN